VLKHSVISSGYFQGLIDASLASQKFADKTSDTGEELISGFRPDNLDAELKKHARYLASRQRASF
jgi:hypothetical protein